MEGPDQVLAGRVIHTGLAAGRRVDLRKQRGRYLHHPHSAHEYRGRKAGDVADHPTSQRHDDAAAVGAGPDQRIDDSRDRIQVLSGLAVGKDVVGSRRYAFAGMPYRVQIKRADYRIRDNVDRSRRERRDEFIQTVEQPGSNPDVVGAGGQLDRDALHL